MNTVSRSIRFGFLAAAIGSAACGSSGGKAPGTDGSADMGGSADTGGPGSDGNTDGIGDRADLPPGDGGNGGGNTPITERPSRGTYQCQVSRARTDHTPRYWRSSPALITTSGGTAYFARYEAMTPNPIIPTAGQLLIGSLAADGTFGPTTVVPTAAAMDVGGMAAAPAGTGFALVWVEGSALRFAAFGAGGAGTIAPRTIATGVDQQSAPRIAAGSDGGFGVVYAVAPTTDSREARLLVLGSDGAARGAARRLDQTGSTSGFAPLPAPAIAASATGYSMIWRNLGDAKGGIEFAGAGLDGAETIARRRLSVTTDPLVVVGGSAGFESPVNALLDVAGGYLAAWVETRRSQSFDGGASSTVWLARLSADGVVQGTPAPLRRAVDSIDEVEPSLVRLGDAVAVLWGRGTHIYICGGCVPDHGIDLLLVDPVDLTPLGAVVSVSSSTMPRGGLLRRQVTALGTSLLTTFDLTFHVHHTSGSAAFSCQK